MNETDKLRADLVAAQADVKQLCEVLQFLQHLTTVGEMNKLQRIRRAAVERWEKRGGGHE